MIVNNLGTLYSDLGQLGKAKACLSEHCKGRRRHLDTSTRRRSTQSTTLAFSTAIKATSKRQRGCLSERCKGTKKHLGLITRRLLTQSTISAISTAIKARPKRQRRCTSERCKNKRKSSNVSTRRRLIQPIIEEAEKIFMLALRGYEKTFGG